MYKKIKVIMCSVVINIILLSVFYSVLAIERIPANSIPYETYIGEYYFKKTSNDNGFAVSKDGKEYRTVETDTSLTNYTILYKNGIYIFIDQSSKIVPSNKMFGASLYNSPIYFFDNNMELINKKEFDGYMEYKNSQDEFIYFKFIDSSGRYYNEANMGFEGDYSIHYYKTINGMSFEEIIPEEYIQNDSEVVFNLHNGYQYYFDDNMLYLKSNRTCKVLREPDDFKRYSASTTNGNILYKIRYDENENVIDQQISFDAINYYSIPTDAELSNIRCDKDYLYCGITGSNDDCYKIKISEYTNGIKVIYKGCYLSFATPPTMEDDRTLVPMRFLFEQMGADVDWEGETQTATVEKGNDKIAFSINNTAAKVNNTIKTMDVPARLINSKTMIPLRFLSEELGYNVEWDQDTRTVTISD